MVSALSHDIQAESSHILASLPNPVFLLDQHDRFVFLNHAAEMFFDSSESMLRDTVLSAQIPSDSAFVRYWQGRALRWHPLLIGDRDFWAKDRFEASQCPNCPFWRPCQP